MILRRIAPVEFAVALVSRRETSPQTTLDAAGADDRVHGKFLSSAKAELQ